MNTFWNILWIFPFFGWVLAILYGILGLVTCATVVGLPLGLGLLQYSKFLFWPHGNAMISKSDLEVITEQKRPLWWRIFAMIVRILYFPFGLVNAIFGVLYGFCCFISILGIPEGLVVMKSIGTLFNPVNKVMVPAALRDEIEKRKALRKYSPNATQSNLPENRHSNTLAVISSTQQNALTTTNLTGTVCHNCGRQLPEESAFCPGCGTPVAREEIPALPETCNEEQSTPADDAYTVRPSIETENPTMLSSGISITYEHDEEDTKKKWILWGGLAAGIIIIAGGLWALWGHSSKIEPNAHVFAEHSIVFKSVMDGEGIEPLDELPYDTEIETQPSEYDYEGVWTKVEFIKDGKKTNGFMAKKDILSTEDFLALHRSGLYDKTIRENLPYNIERQAILLALKSRDGNWSLEKIADSDGVRPNSKRMIVRGVNVSEQCLGFILRNNQTNERIFFLYSLPDLYTSGNRKIPVFQHSEPVKEDNVRVHDVTFKKNLSKFNVIYKKTADLTPVVYEEHITQPAETEEKLYDGLLEMKGYVDGKYPIKIELELYGDGTTSGTIRYLKYNVPMKLNGDFYAKSENREISLTESSEEEVTGYFHGNYDGRVFSGTWVSADETKRMPFRVER